MLKKMELFREISGYRMKIKLIEALIEQDENFKTENMSKMIALRQNFDTQFNTIVAKLIVEVDRYRKLSIIDELEKSITFVVKKCKIEYILPLH